ncbi:MAG: hypothetical protein ACHQ50_04105, partial [Fimbriimonadales bacterium]
MGAVHATTDAENWQRLKTRQDAGAPSYCDHSQGSGFVDLHSGAQETQRPDWEVAGRRFQHGDTGTTRGTRGA